MSILESEFIERSALGDLHQAAQSQDIEEAGVHSQTLNSAVVSMGCNLPASAIVLNRTLGLGLGVETSKEEVEAVVSAYAEHDINRYFIQVHPQHEPEQLEGWLADSGLTAARAWQKFSRGRDPVSESKSDLVVREIGAEYGTAFAQIVYNAFDLGEKSVNWLSRLPARADWHVFMSFCDGSPAGVGALFMKDGLGWTDFGATAPEFRLRGSQSILMQARLTFALDMGCQRIYTCTGVSTPGDPQHSYSNILEAGFVEEHVTANYQPELATNES